VIPPTQGLGALALAAVAALGVGAFAYRAWRLYRYLRLGWNEDRRAHLGGRLKDELVIYLLQRKLLKRPYYLRGIAHAFIFWGFLVITIGTIDLLASGIAGFRVPGTGRALFAWTIDIFAVLVLVSFTTSAPSLVLSIAVLVPSFVLSTTVEVVSFDLSTTLLPLSFTKPTESATASPVASRAFSGPLFISRSSPPGE